ncbi:regulator of volume decrease after cellular swelling-domain-containing protein [Stachybotrys elegans]|uniref:Regulator of volume decrease after cellular swelling-domain-containing protein n=1 Tax=Stachybotrys elegans TaxID=80388 RepID=A0A8K0SPQ8_9HYPO|nr:regulator of volume decrease after cellular swelling-domain-containing protein [Stachybotrys elegans]
MPITTIRTPPSVEDYTPLSVYESSTPESFIGGKPVLHFDVRNVRATVPRSQRGILSIFPEDAPAAVAEAHDSPWDDLVEQRVNVFVNSANFTIFSLQAEQGLEIPYPCISIHAVKQVGSAQAVWMQLEFSDGGAGDDDFKTVELTITPPPIETEPSMATQLYTAIANCSNLHPDPLEAGEEDDDDDRIIFEGSQEHEALEGGGWITADNVNEYFDENGNWIGEGAGEEEAEELGEGAGRSRPRDELEQSDVNGHANGDDSDNKRPRLE